MVDPQHTVFSALRRRGRHPFRDHKRSPETSQTSNQDSQSNSMVKEFGVDLTWRADKGILDKVFGRLSEMDRMVEILLRRTKNNPVLVGDAGVGKTAIVEGIAQRIASSDIPKQLIGHRVISLDLGAMIGGTKYRGEFEERMRALMQEVEQAGNIILFIDEIHMLLRAGRAEGSLDAANLLKPALAKGKLRVIGATTWTEYRQHFSSDKALYRRFQPIKVEEPAPDEATNILRALSPVYEEYHGLPITDEALSSAVTLSTRFISNRLLPDKAIDLMDEAMARAKVNRLMPPTAIRDLRQQLNHIRQTRLELPDNSSENTILDLAAQEAVIRDDLLAKRKLWLKKLHKSVTPISATDIAVVVAQWTGIKTVNITPDEASKFLDLEDNLETIVVGQTKAVEVVSRALRRAMAGLREHRQPIGSFLFLGPTGVGKSTLAQALAKVVSGTADRLIKIDMAELNESHMATRLLGAPPGYAGYTDSPRLIDAVKRDPYSIVMFDNIDKAHPSVVNTLMQILDNGHITDPSGRLVDFSHAIVIMSCNTDTVSENNIGFSELHAEGQNAEIPNSQILSATRKKFPAEFLNKLNHLVVFNPLSEEHFREIGRRMLGNLVRRMADLDIELIISSEALEFIVARTRAAGNGARPLIRMIENDLEDLLSTTAINGFKKGDILKISAAEEELTISTNCPDL